MHYRHFCFWFTYECPCSTALKNCSYLSNKIMFSPLFTLHPCDRWNAIVVRCTVALQKQMVNVRRREGKKKITPAAKTHSFRSNCSVGHILFLIGQLMRWTAQELAALCSEERQCPEQYTYILYIVLSTVYASGSVLIRM